MTTTIRPFSNISKHSLTQPKARCSRPLLVCIQHRLCERFHQRSDHSTGGRRSASTLTRSLSWLQDGDFLSSYQQRIQHHRIIGPSCLGNGSLLASSHNFFSTEASAESSKDKGSTPSSKKVSLALSVYFKQPELGMKDYEILSRATAFLLAVDPPPPPPSSSEVRSSNDSENTNNSEASPYSSHLLENERRRQEKLYKQTHRYTPASGRREDDFTNSDGSEQRPLQDLSWLEFAPREVRPVVHVVCSSHVLSPFLWRQYYPQEWLNKVRQEHWYVTLTILAGR